MGDAWFGSVKVAAVVVKRDMEVAHQIKSNYSLFSKQFIKESLKDAPGGYHVALEGKQPSRADLVAIECRHNSKVALSFVTSKNAGSRRKCSSYEIKFSDSHGDVHVRLVDQLLVISDFFEVSNPADKHN